MMNVSIDVRYINEKEALVGENRILMQEGNLLCFIPVGEHDVEIASKCIDTCLNIMNRREGKVNMLIDLNKMGKISAKARKMYQGANDNEKVGKVAQIGMHPVARIIGSFVMGISKNRNMNFFKTKEDALTWLKD